MSLVTAFVAFALAVSVAAPVAAEPPDASQAVAEAGISAGVRGWKTAYRKSSAGFVFGVTGGWMPLPWLQVVGALDHARRTSSPDQLKITSTETWLTIGPRASVWFDFLRFFAEAGAAGALRTASYRDADIKSPARLSLGVSLGAGLTVAVAERVGITMRGAWRRRDNQSHIIATLDATWLFGRGERNR